MDSLSSGVPLAGDVEPRIDLMTDLMRVSRVTCVRENLHVVDEERENKIALLAHHTELFLHPAVVGDGKVSELTSVAEIYSSLLHFSLALQEIVQQKEDRPDCEFSFVLFFLDVSPRVIFLTSFALSLQIR